MSSTPGRRLGEHVLARRTELDLTQLDVWQSGGPSNTTLTRIENGLLETLTRTTARKLDEGLRWEPGTAKGIWEGRAVPSIPPEIMAEIEKLSPATREFVLRSIENDRLAARQQATEAGESA